MATEILTWENDSGELIAVVADAVISSKDERTAEVTSHPVENGSDVTDHVRQLPDRITLELAQTETPIEEQEGFSFTKQELDVRKSLFQPGGLLLAASAVGAAVGALLGAVGGDVVKTMVLSADSDTRRVDDIHDKLLEAKQNAYPITVTWRGRVYPDFLITTLSLSRSAGEFGLGRFSLEAQSFRTVQTGSAELPDPVDLRAKNTSSRGKKPSETLSEAEETVTKRSLLSQGLDSLLEGF